MASRTPREILRIPTERVAVRKITPQMAADLLSTNTGNRQIQERNMRALAADMADGKFILNGDAIRFSGTKLIDGQHRLAACVASGVPFETVVVVDLDGEECFPTIDVGKRRSFSDLLYINGNHNTSTLSAIVVAHYNLTNNNYSSRATSAGSLSRYSDWLAKTPGLRAACEWYVSHSRAFRTLGFGQSVLAALWYEFGLRSPEDRDEFFSLWESGSNLDQTSPILMLRNRLINNSMSRTRLAPRDIVAIIIKAWNLHRIGGSVHNLRWRRDGNQPEAFPTIG